MPTTELDLSVARLLLLAEQIERREVAPAVFAPAPIVEGPLDAPPPAVDLDYSLSLTDAPPVVAAEVLLAEPYIQVEAEADVPVEAEPVTLEPPLEPRVEDIAPPAVDLPEVATAPAPVKVAAPEPVSPPEHRPLADVADYGRLEQVRVILSQLNSRHLGPRGRRRLEEARHEERAILDRLGFDSYLDLMLTNAGTRQSASLPSRRVNGERDGNGGGIDGGIDGGGASADIGAGGTTSDAGASNHAPPAGDADDRPLNGSDEASEVACVWAPDSVEVHVDIDGASPSSVESPRPPTIADWLASASAPPIAAATVVDVGA